MSSHVILVDLFAVLLVVAGLMMAFRQRQVRRWWRAFRPRDPAAPQRPVRPEEEDPVHYALIIFGIMLGAFGLILFGFTTVFNLTT